MDANFFIYLYQDDHMRAHACKLFFKKTSQKLLTGFLPNFKNFSSPLQKNQAFGVIQVLN